ncbi:flagellar filament capping protein FliD [Geomicrobium sp. JCM 19039]|uniref:flagellar filament capping protein FliD n=1 Tax=Geomicrobium sp. JCM 19039 TaxID=1460636 RepID=UPI00045F473A|nr:flagellar filament capping protein FliD [Geomicrobium sp. JCM 19039]GAK11644.1 flagellar hook-associated protein FliD [Geomicrobium sp. JCM 19039]
MRISGFASGMDIDQMVRDLMRAERAPMDKFMQQQTFKNWQVEAYRELNTKIRSFEQSVFDRLLTPSKFLGRTGTSTNDSLVSVTSSSGTGNAQYTINSVSQLATAASAFSKERVGGEDFDVRSPLVDQYDDWSTGKVVTDTAVHEGDGQFSFGSEHDNIKADSETIVRVNGRTYQVVNDEPEAGQVRIDGNTLQFEDGAVGENDRVEVEFITDAEGQYKKASMSTFNERGEEVMHSIFIKPEESLQTVMNKFNNSGVGVNMFYDDHQGQVVVSRTDTGVFNEDGPEIRFDPHLGSENSGANTFFGGFLNLEETNDQGAKNAKFEINGLSTERRSNTFSVGNLTMTLGGIFDSPVTVSSSVDTDKIVDNITAFVDEYNALIDEIHGNVNERQNRDFPPLTDEQRREMSEYEVEMWEEKARSGLMSRDRQLSAFLSDMRMTMYQTVENGQSDIRHLSDLGITTSNDYLENGKLEIDQAKLRAAVQDDPEGAYNFFAQTGENPGLARQLRSDLNGASDMVSRKAGGSSGRHQNHQFSLGRELNNLDTRISNFERRLEQKEQRYWRQFTAMEQAIARANSQGDMLYNFMFGNGNMM